MKSTKKKIAALCLALVMLFGILPLWTVTVTAASANTGTLYAYPEFDERIERDYLYSVSVTDKNGTTALPVYNHAEDSRTTRNTVDVSADEYRRFSTFSFDGTVTVNIKVNRDFTSYSVIPSAKGIASTFDSSTGTIKVTLSEPIYFMIRLDGMDSTNLALLADEPEDPAEIPTAGENTYIYTDSWNEVSGGVLKLKKDNSIVYIAPGAVLNARIKITGDNCRVIGRGAIVDPYSDIFNYDESDAGEYNLLYIKNANNAVIDGVHLLNAHAYNIEAQGEWGGPYADGTRITNVKILSTQMSSDGIMLNYYLTDARAERCFVYCGDNALNYEDNATYQDILVGTTCNAIFPQTDVTNSHLENIYVFRAEDNIINTEYGGSASQTMIDDHTITNLYAQDVTCTTAFLFIEAANKGVNPDGSGTVITNVCLPRIDGIGNRFYRNTYEPGNGNHRVTMKNVYVDGSKISSISTSYDKLIESLSTNKTGNALSGWGEIKYPKDMSFSYSTTTENSSFASATKTKNSTTVNYSNADYNVKIGNCQVYFANPVRVSGGTKYLPYRQIKAYLGNVGGSTNLQKFDGVEYISTSELTASGTKMASAVSISGNVISITPYNLGMDLLTPDSGISKFTEYKASSQHLTAKMSGSDMVYTVTDAGSGQTEGIYRLITEELKKYGTGSYTLSFQVKTSGSSGKTLTTLIDYGEELDDDKIGSDTTTTLSTSWQTVSKTFSVTSDHLEQKNLAILIYDAGKTIDDFSIRRVKLTKSGGSTGYTITWNVGSKAIREKWVSGVTPKFDAQTTNGLGLFTGWDKTVAAASADATYTAQYAWTFGLEISGVQVRARDNAVRLVGKIGDYRFANLGEVGFEITVGRKTVDCPITKVYTNIIAGGETIYADPSDHSSHTKFFTFCIEGTPVGTEFTVRAYAVVNGQRLITDSGRFVFIGNDVVIPGILNVRPNNAVEDTISFGNLF